MTDLRDIQRHVGVTADGVLGPATLTAIAKALGLYSAVTDEVDEAATRHLRAEEGVQYKAYKDHLGYWTNGVGRLIDNRKGGGYSADEQNILLANNPARSGQPIVQWVLTDPEVNMLLKNDIAKVRAQMADWPSWKAVQGNTARTVAMISMAFQLGAAGLAGFKNSLEMVAQKRWEDAAANMLLSLWAKQTPARARRVTDMIKTGEWAR